LSGRGRVPQDTTAGRSTTPQRCASPLLWRYRLVSQPSRHAAGITYCTSANSLDTKPEEKMYL